MAKRHGVYDSDQHFIINPTTRTMRNDGYTKSGLIQNDHNSERITFEIPKVIEGHDMTKCDVVQVHYDNGGSKGIYEVEDMQISPKDPDVVIFSWLISGNATKNVGALNFSVRFMCLGDNNEVEYAWNTAVNSTVSVSEGVYNTESVVEENIDILEQWKAEILAETKAMIDYYHTFTLNLNLDSVWNPDDEPILYVKVNGEIVNAEFMPDESDDYRYDRDNYQLYIDNVDEYGYVEIAFAVEYAGYDLGVYDVENCSYQYKSDLFMDRDGETYMVIRFENIKKGAYARMLNG